VVVVVMVLIMQGMRGRGIEEQRALQKKCDNGDDENEE
jgi:hypothetical protein